MAELIAKSPLSDLLPLKIGANEIAELSLDAITSIAPFKGQDAAVSDALKTQIGAALPKPNRTTGKANARVVWSGRGQAFVLGPKLDPLPGAATSDQTDGWVSISLKGPGARDVLARITPLDLRETVFKTGHAARSLIGHMHGVILRTGADRYDVMVFRSMADTLVHEMTEAMETVAARA